MEISWGLNIIRLQGPSKLIQTLTLLFFYLGDALFEFMPESRLTNDFRGFPQFR